MKYIEGLEKWLLNENSFFQNRSLYTEVHKVRRPFIIPREETRSIFYHSFGQSIGINLLEHDFLNFVYFLDRLDKALHIWIALTKKSWFLLVGLEDSEDNKYFFQIMGILSAIHKQYWQKFEGFLPPLPLLTPIEDKSHFM